MTNIAGHNISTLLLTALGSFSAGLAGRIVYDASDNDRLNVAPVTPSSIMTLTQNEGSDLNGVAALSSLDPSFPPEARFIATSDPLTEEELIERQQLLERAEYLQRELAWYRAEAVRMDEESLALKAKVNGWVEEIGDISDSDPRTFSELEFLRLRAQGALNYLTVDEYDEARVFKLWVGYFPMRYTVEEAVAISKTVHCSDIVCLNCDWKVGHQKLLKQAVPLVGKDRILAELSDDQLFKIFEVVGSECFTTCFGQEGLNRLQQHDPDLYQQYLYDEMYGLETNSDEGKIDKG